MEQDLELRLAVLKARGVRQSLRTELMMRAEEIGADLKNLVSPYPSNLKYSSGAERVPESAFKDVHDLLGRLHTIYGEYIVADATCIRVHGVLQEFKDNE